MSRPEVSVVVPVYNRERLVGAALASLQQQAGTDLEIIVVDDGSTDGSVAVARRVAADDPRITVLEGAHAGPATARNHGVAVARGDYLTFLDSDDLCPRGRIHRQVDKLRTRPDFVAVVGALLGFHALDAAGEPMPDPIYGAYHDASLPSATFRTEAFRRLGPLDEALIFAEDVDFFLRLIETDATLLLERDVASYIRYHGGNMVRDIHAKQRGYLQAYTRSIRRRRAAGRTEPLRSFFPRTYARDIVYSGATGTQ